MSYLIYLRKSRKDREAEARGEGETLARHETILLNLAQEKNLEIGDIYRELVSGETIAARPLMQKLLSQVEQGQWQGVLVMEIERLARGNTIDQGLVAQAFRYSDTCIITPFKTYDPQNEFDEEYFEFGLFMSRREYKTINRRMQQGRKASASEGKFIGNKAPYGYTRKKLAEGKGYTLIPHEQQADILRQIFRRYGQEQFSPAEIAQHLNELAVPSPSGGIWSAAGIRSLLANPVYQGMISSGRRPTIKKLEAGAISSHRPSISEYTCYMGLHQPIIDEALAKAVKDRRERLSPVRTGKSYPLQNPLAGIIFCSCCGKAMIRRPGKKDQPALLLCPNKDCPTVGSYLEPVEQAVLSVMKDRLDGMDIGPISSHSEEKTAFLRRNLANIDKSLTLLEKQAENACNLLEQGIYDADTFRRRQQTIKKNIEKKNDIRKNICCQLAQEEKTTLRAPCSIMDIYKKCQSAKNRNKLLKCMLAKIVYEKTSGGRWDKQAPKLTLYPLFPAASAPKEKNGRIGSSGDHSHFGL